MSLGLNLSSAPPPVPDERVTTASELPLMRIEKSLGIVQATCEVAFKKAGIGGVGLVEGGRLAEASSEALTGLRDLAGKLGANAIIGVGFSVSGRELEKSVLAWGTEVVVTRND